jgi:hypothetical protein
MLTVAVLRTNTETGKQERQGEIALAEDGVLEVIADAGTEESLEAFILDTPEVLTAGGKTVLLKEDPEKWLRSLFMNFSGSYFRVTEAYDVQ